MSESSKALGSAVLLAALLLATTSAVAAAQGKLTITINGSDSEWNVPGWVCPGASPCEVPTKANTAWLCCNTTGTPRECQLVWRDEYRRTTDRDLRYVRVYFGKEGTHHYVYAYAWINSFLLDSVVIDITTGEGYLLRINVSGSSNAQDSFYRLYSPDGTVLISGNLGKNLARELSDYTSGVLSLRGVEMRFNFSALGTYSALFQSGEYTLSVSLQRKLPTGTFTDVANVGSTADKIKLVVDEWRIVNSYYVEEGVRYPIPIPEPGVLVSAATVITALGVIAFATTKRR